MRKHSSRNTPSGRSKKIAAIAAAPLAVAALSSLILGFSTQSKTTDAHEPKHLKPRADDDALTTAKPSATLIRPSLYTVAEGDTLKDIAGRVGVSTAELLAVNGLSWRTMLVVGQELRVPSETAVASDRDANSSILVHRVVAGDTLEAISRLHRVQPRAIMSANGLDNSSRLVIGQRLVIPNADLMGQLPALPHAGVSA